MYAVFETGGKQYRAGAGDTVTVEKLDAEAGKPVTFDRVLLVSNDGQITVGSPLVEQANVVADVVEHKRGPKLIAFKMKRRKGHRCKIGHRQDLTVVKVTDITTGGKAKKATEVEEPKAAKKTAKKEPKAEAPAEKKPENKE
jgi:large subunit ribosomal protein L21